MKRPRPLRTSFRGDAFVAAKWRHWAEGQARRKQRIWPDGARGSIQISSPDVGTERVRIELRRVWPDWDQLLITGYKFGACAFYLRSGLMEYEDGFFPLESLFRPPGILHEGDGTAALGALSPPMDGVLTFSGPGQYQTSPLDDPIFYGLSEAEYNALPPEEQAIANARLQARINQMLISRDVAQYPTRTHWWLSSLISQPAPSLVPDVDQASSLPNFWFIEPTLDLRLDLDDTVVAYIEPATPAELEADSGHPGHWRYLLARMPTINNAWMLQWRPMALTPCAQALLDTLLRPGAPTGLLREALERFAMIGLSVIEGEVWRDVTVTGADVSWGSTNWCRYGWTANWGVGTDFRTAIVREDAVFDDNGGSVVWVDHWDTRALEMSLGFSHAWDAGNQAQVLTLTAACTQVAIGSVTFPTSMGHLWLPSFALGREGQSSWVNPMANNPTAATNVPPPSGLAPMYPIWWRDQPGEAGTLDLIWASAEDMPVTNPPVLQSHPLCGVGSMQQSRVAQGAGERVTFYCARASVSGGIDSRLEETRTWTASANGMNTTGNFSSGPYPTDLFASEHCDYAAAQAVDDEISAYFSNNLTGGRGHGTRVGSLYEVVTTQRRVSEASAGSFVAIPARSRNIAYLGRFEKYRERTWLYHNYNPNSIALVQDAYTYKIADPSDQYPWPVFERRHTGTTSSYPLVTTDQYRLDENVTLVGPTPLPITVRSDTQTDAVAGALTPQWEAWLDPDSFFVGGQFLGLLMKAYDSHQSYIAHTDTPDGVDWAETGNYLPAGRSGGFFGYVGVA